MGLLDSIKSKVLGGSSAQTTLLNGVMGLLGNQQTGGIAGLVQQFTGKGLGDIVNSWVGMGQNLPITPEQIKQGLGSDAVSQLASKAGLTPDQVTSHLSELLPKMVDKLTPNGQIPTGDITSKGMELLKGILK
jgi:uncharacterized protein YidB (DUF937 family)